MAIGQDIGMGTSYGGGITGLNTGVNLAATGLQTSNAPRPRMPGTPNLNQLYQTAMDAFRKTAPSGWQTESYFTPTTGNAEFAKYAPEGGILTNLTQGDRRKLSQGVHKNQWLADLMGGTSGTGITTLTTGTDRTEPLAQFQGINPITGQPETYLEGTSEYHRVAKGLPAYETFPTEAEFLQQKQAAWRAQNPDPAVMPNFQIIGTDLAASEAAGYDVPLWGEGQSVGPEGMPYMPTLDQLAQMDAIKLKIDAGTATQEEIDLFNQLNFGRPLLPDEQGVFAGGGIVGLDHLTRRL